MKFPTVQQYKDSISRLLLPKQIEALQILYNCPNSTATAIQLAELIDPSKPSSPIARFRIGKIGKLISECSGIQPDTYKVGIKALPAYSKLVSEKYVQGIGWTLIGNLKTALEELYLVNKLADNISERLTTEIFPFDEKKLFAEGSVVKVLVNKYERNRTARIKCIQHYGARCYVCKFDFGMYYGKVAEGYIHVHHLLPLWEIHNEYVVDPIKDLRPLCPNCHAAIHLDRSITIEDLKKLIEQNFSRCR